MEKELLEERIDDLLRRMNDFVRTQRLIACDTGLSFDFMYHLRLDDPKYNSLVQEADACAFRLSEII